MGVFIMNFPSTQNPEEALTLALTLSLTASDDVKAKECADMADSIAATLDAETIERCKQRALTISQEAQ
tara:strand:+ start:1318 stop:1524 length:207 start_codon:yes stop_codon:yes gene_type:complete